MIQQDIIAFWFEEIDSSLWWKKDAEFDALIEQRFLGVHEQAIQSEYFTWRESAIGALAEVIILDQFSRNIYRDQAKAFAYDALALALAQSAVAKGLDQQLEPMQRSFLYMPYMHSESALIHEQAEMLFIDLGIESTLEFERKHKVIIDRFGRYPHRNQLLGRQSTEEEKQFLTQPDSSF